MNILYLCHRIPYPPNKGDKIRSYHQLCYLAREHNIFLGTISDKPESETYRQHLQSLCQEVLMVNPKGKSRLFLGIWGSKPLTIRYFHHWRLQAYVEEVLKSHNIDVVICFSSSMAEYVFRSAVLNRNVRFRPRLIMDFVDLDSQKWRQYAETSAFPRRQIYRLENKRLFRYELEVLRSFDRCMFASQREVELLQNQGIDTSEVAVIENGLDADYFTPKAESPDNPSPVLLFTGVMDYHANVDGVRWFSHDILPLIRRHVPAVQFKIVGMRPARAVRRLARIAGVEVTGYVEDIRPYYWGADLFVAPLRTACGVQNKLLEAMATGNAVVTTRIASAGIHCQHHHDVLIADSATDFARQVVTLLQNRNKRDRIAANAIATIHQRYNWERKLRVLQQLLQA